jgi:hypothetical protein
MGDHYIDPHKKYRTKSHSDLLKCKEHRDLGRLLVREINSIKNQHDIEEESRPYLTGEELINIVKKYNFNVKQKKLDIIIQLDNLEVLEVKVINKKSHHSKYLKRGKDGKYHLPAN